MILSKPNTITISNAQKEHWRERRMYLRDEFLGDCMSSSNSRISIPPILLNTNFTFDHPMPRNYTLEENKTAIWPLERCSWHQITQTQSQSSFDMQQICLLTKRSLLFSPSPNHRKSCIIFSTLLVTLAGIFNRDRKYKGILDKEASTKVNLLISEMQATFQLISFSEILFTIEPKKN